MTCSRCSAEAADDSVWCLSCGVWLSSSRGVCEGAELEEAVGACVVCGRPVCDVCKNELNGRLYCTEDEHGRLPDTHVVLGRFGSEFEADWVTRNLVQRGIRARVFGYRSNPGLYGIDLPVEASVFVHREDEKKGREIMNSFAGTKG